MYPAGYRVDHPGQGIDIGALEFLETPVFEEVAGYGMLGGKLLKHLHVG